MIYLFTVEVPLVTPEDGSDYHTDFSRFTFSSCTSKEEEDTLKETFVTEMTSSIFSSFCGDDLALCSPENVEFQCGE